MVFRKDIGQFTEWKSSVCRRTIKGLMMVGVKILLGSLVLKLLLMFVHLVKIRLLKFCFESAKAHAV